MIIRLDEPCSKHKHDPARREAILRAALPEVRENGAIALLGELPVPPRIAVFDLDGTLIPCEFIDRVAQQQGVAHLTRRLTARAMSGEMDFRRSYLRRLEILRGIPVAELNRSIENIPLTAGAETTLTKLHASGIPTAIVTGGYARLGRAVQKRLGVDMLYATELEERDGVLTGLLAGPLLDEEGKVAALRDFCALHGFTPRDAVAVGDGANDLRMLSEAGLAILYTSIPQKAGAEAQPLDAILGGCLNFPPT